MMALLKVDYEEGDQRSYRAVEAKIADIEKRRFDSGDPVSDFKAAVFWSCLKVGDNIYLSSSVDHFVSDGECFVWEVSPIYGDYFDWADGENSLMKFLETDE